MGEVSTRIDLETFLEIPIDEEQHMVTTTHAHHTTSPVWRLSPRHNGSTLYDSYEFRAVTNQLNKAIQASKASSPHYMYCFNSPFYKQGLSRSAMTPKRVVRQRQLSAASADKNPSTKPGVGARELVARAWKKVKQGFLKNKQRND